MSTLVEGGQEHEEQDLRRARSSMRIPFDGVVEVGGELGPPFEAQAVDVSGTGMHLRTAYLPEVGQAVSCRFEAGRETVIATGEVVWQKEAGRGGEFGLRFIDLDPDSMVALERMTDRVRLSVPGAKVRLHIDGLGAPMRARVRNTNRSELKVGSELAFLQVGKHIDLEDAESGHKRPAEIDRVEVEMSPGSRIPQLVVALRYADQEPEPVASPVYEDMPNEDPMAADPPIDHHHDDQHYAAEGAGDGTPRDDVDVAMSDAQQLPASHEAPRARAASEVDADEESMRMKSPVARAAAKVTPALERFAKRTKTTAMLLLERAKQRRLSESSPIRRTTAPAPAGSLHASGRKVVRGEPTAADIPQAGLGAFLADRKRVVMIGSGAALALIIGISFAAKKPSTPPAPNAETATNAPLAPETAPAAPTPTAAAAPVAQAPVTTTSGPAPGGATMPIAADPSMSSMGPDSFADRPTASGSDARDSGDARHKKHPMKVTPFAYGNVSHGNVLRIKMDGAIEKIQGAQQPTGFTVHIPGRHSLEAAAPLAARDARIGSIKVTNDPGGAELAVTFKDGVPNYNVRAKGDALEIVLATPGALGQDDAPAAAKAAHAHQKNHQKPHAVAKHGKHGKSDKH